MLRAAVSETSLAPTNQPTSPSTQASGQVCPYTTPYPLCQNILLKLDDAPFLRALLLVGYSVFGLEMEPRCAGACVVCWPLRALWATSTCSAPSWSAATTNNDVIATSINDVIATTNNNVIATTNNDLIATTALLWFCACS